MAEKDTAEKKKKKRGPRRFNGTGSVYKLSDGRRRNPWVARISPECDEGGKPINIYSYHETAFDADKAISKMEEGYWAGKNRNPLADDTVDMVWERYKRKRFPKLGEMTAKGYTNAYSHLADIQGRKIADLTTNDLQDVLDKKAGMSYSLQSKIRACMVSIFNEAAKDDIVKRNYASLLELSKTEPNNPRRSFTDEELVMIIAAAFGDAELGFFEPVPYADVVLVQCLMGWRPTEMCLLTPDSVDMDGWFITGGIKTDAGKERKVPVHPLIQPIATDWMYRGNERLFTNEVGGPLNKDTWGTRFNSAMVRIFGEKVAVPYTTRHTCASLLHAAGADHLSIARIMGHKDYTITARVYTHVQLKELKAAVDKLALGTKPR